MVKKLTLEQLDKDVLEAMDSPVQNGPRRLQPRRAGVIKGLLEDTKAGGNGGATPPTTTPQTGGR